MSCWELKCSDWRSHVGWRRKRRKEIRNFIVLAKIEIAGKRSFSQLTISIVPRVVTSIRNYKLNLLSNRQIQANSKSFRNNSRSHQLTRIDRRSYSRLIFHPKISSISSAAAPLLGFLPSTRSFLFFRIPRVDFTSVPERSLANLRLFRSIEAVWNAKRRGEMESGSKMEGLGRNEGRGDSGRVAANILVMAFGLGV